MRRAMVTLLGPALLVAGCGYDDLCWRGNCGSYEANCGYTCVDDNCYSDCEGQIPRGDAGVDPSCDPYCGDPPRPVEPDGGVEPSPYYPYCQNDWECYQGEECVDGFCEPRPTQYCETSAECPEGWVCGLWNTCLETVPDCPLTDTCLADPEGYTPEWQGIDPYYAGEVVGPGFVGRVELIVDFYSDHLYGDAQALVTLTEGGGTEYLDLIVTGDRLESMLDGQVVERWAQPRRFDATFVGELITASEITLTVTVAMDEACFDVEVHLYRISPCGCTPGQCVADDECEAQELCIEGSCKWPCASNCDCPSGQYCDEGFCAQP